MMNKILVEQKNSHLYVEESLAALPVTSYVNKDLPKTIAKAKDFLSHNAKA